MRNPSVADIIAIHPTFERQMRVWQTERAQRGEDPFNWELFRELETDLGAPDPGDAPPSEFFWFTAPTRVSAGPILIEGEAPRPGKQITTPAEWMV